MAVPSRHLLAVALVVALGCGSPEERAESARQRFDEALSRDDLAEALRAWEALADSLPETPDARLELARRLNRAGESGRALWILEEGAERYPDHTPLRLELAKTALVVSDPARALGTLRGLSEEGREHVGAVLMLSQAQLALGDLEAGLSTLAEAEARHPDRIELRIARIEALSKENRFADALELTREALRRTDLPPAPRRWLTLEVTELLAMTNDLEGSLRALEAMIEADPQDAEAWQRRVGILVGRGHAEEACTLLSRAVAAHPDAADLYRVLASAQLARGDQAAAEAALRALEERTPGPAGAEALARFLHYTGRSIEGAKVLGEAVERAGDEAPVELAYLHVAMLLSAGEPEAAERAFGVFRQRYEGDPRVEYLRARFELQEGRNAAAAARLKRLAPQLDRSDVQHWIGVALERMGDDAGAEYRYAMAINRNPAQIPSYLGILRVLERQESWLRMDGFARALIRNAPGNVYGFEALTRALRGRGERDTEIAVLRTYARRFPDLPAPVVALSVSLRARGESREALAVLDEAAPRFGGDPLWIAERASVLEHLGRPAEGLREVERALAEHPQNAALHRARAYLLFRADRGGEALGAVETLLSLDPDDPAPLRMSGDFLSMRGDFAGARRAYERHLALQPNDSRVLFHLGIALQQLGQPESALAAYRRSVAIDAEFLPARNNLAMLLAETGRIDEGLLAAQANYARAPDEAVVMDTLAWLYLKQGLAERAVALLERAGQAAPGSQEIRAHLEEARRATSRPRSARAPEDAPTAPLEVDLRARLAGLGRPHIVLVLVDTLRADWTSPYGFDTEVTPELQRWADGGVVFERALAQSSWTKVSMASLFTSLWPRSHGLRLATDGLGARALTLSEVLREAGYRTCAVQSNGWLEQSFGFHQGFDRYVFPRTVAHPRVPDGRVPDLPVPALHGRPRVRGAAGVQALRRGRPRPLPGRHPLGRLAPRAPGSGARSPGAVRPQRPDLRQRPRRGLRREPQLRTRKERLHSGAPRSAGDPFPLRAAAAPHPHPGEEPRHRTDDPGPRRCRRSEVVRGVVPAATHRSGGG
jgi:tetratricopeptide (TPR) repeat protein